MSCNFAKNEVSYYYSESKSCEICFIKIGSGYSFQFFREKQLQIIQKGVDLSIQDHYDVLKFIEHGGRCRPAMDYIQGELLIYRLKHCKEMEKALLFEWMRELLCQLEYFHKCFSNQGYRYVNPYSVLVTAKGKLLLLDLKAESNEFVLRNMQKRAMREHFVKPIVHIRENTRISLDLYGYAKTIQFILANVHVEPSLTSREENRLEKIIDKCLCKNSKKQYDDLKQVHKELPSLRGRNRKPGKKEQKKEWKKRRILLLITAGILAVLLLNFMKNRKSEEQDQNSTEMRPEGQEKMKLESQEMERSIQDDTEENTRQEIKKPDLKEQGNREYPQDGMKELEENVDSLQEYVFQNTTSDNQEIIEQGEELKRELYRYLAAAYDREEMKEQALDAYQELCGTEVREELLEAAYLRRITLEMEQSREIALETAKEALSRIPDSEVLAEKSLEVLAGMEAMTKEERRKELEILEGLYPNLKLLENDQKAEEAGNPEIDAK